ncbi:hypothetical protein [Nocardiopsis ansamitocini]|uniref:TPM domain-containing protein n=1 Tax=Nocardiopsis ansamitocini TaxID=1670832 RepID=A0A9W6P9D9_9ACTN|nr:hypothetical protein [Nocardiopsis ansamitocini]GLU49575.1 hypothetical protein Nans01_39260 [Nocardiopsis ansamitocini]
MSDPRPAAGHRLIRLAALAAAAMLSWPTAAVAQDSPSPSATIADALSQRPVYVDPSLESVLSAEAQEGLVEQIESSDESIYVIVVPLVRGDAWDGDEEQLIGVVSDRLEGDGRFLAMGADSRLDGKDYGGGSSHALYAALAVNIDPEMDNAPLATRLERAVDLTAAGTGEQEYERLYEERDTGGSGLGGLLSGASGQGARSGTGLLLGGGALLVVVVGLGLLLVRRRRTNALPPPLPHSTFAAIDTAQAAQLRSELRSAVTEQGERLASFSLEGASEKAGTAFQKALDAGQAAGKALDETSDLAGLAGVRVLLDMSSEALEATRAGRSAPAPSPHCFFNPLHKGATAPASWRAVGSRQRVRVPACVQCAGALKTHREPEALPATHEGRRIPYYEVPAERSVWAATGYGTLRSDLVQRILRGDLREGS